MEIVERDGIIGVAVGENIYINGNIHDVNFDFDGELIVVPMCGYVLSAKATETVVGEHAGITYVKTVFSPMPETDEALKKIYTNFPLSIVFSSIVTAQAYPGEIMAMCDAPGYERAVITEKRKTFTKFLTFLSMIKHPLSSI